MGTDSSVRDDSSMVVVPSTIKPSAGGIVRWNKEVISEFNLIDSNLLNTATTGAGKSTGEGILHLRGKLLTILRMNHHCGFPERANSQRKDLGHRQR